MREVCNAQWDDIQDRLKEKDAEIEQLRGVVEDLSDHGVAAERMERLKAQGKEIERLKALLTRAADALRLLNRPANSPAISGLIVELRREVLNETMSQRAQVQEGTRVQDCADRSGPYSNPID
jgi:archaellum component FlaC